MAEGFQVSRLFLDGNVIGFGKYENGVLHAVITDQEIVNRATHGSVSFTVSVGDDLLSGMLNDMFQSEEKE